MEPLPTRVSTQRSGVGAGPVERNVLARTASAVPLEPEGVSPVCGGFPVGCYATRARFAPAGIVHLHPLAGWGRRAAERLGTGCQLAGNLSPPRREVIVNVDPNASKLHPTCVADETPDDRRPPTYAARCALIHWMKSAPRNPAAVP